MKCTSVTRLPVKAELWSEERSGLGPICRNSSGNLTAESINPLRLRDPLIHLIPGLIYSIVATVLLAPPLWRKKFLRENFAEKLVAPSPRSSSVAYSAGRTLGRLVRRVFK